MMPLKKTTVLTADDDPHLLRLVMRNLELEGYEVLTASGITGGDQQRPAVGVTHVFIRSEAYQPSNIQVPVGTVVTWTNRDNVPHTVTLAHVMESTNDIWESGQLSPGDSFSYTFTSRGTFTYYCSDHPSTMAGVVTVM
jgi:plastocyanin